VSPKILVVDDSENIRSVLRMNFEWMGYDVTAAADGVEAIASVEHDRPDLIILDVMMPRKNGYQVCRQFKSDPRTADIPVILLTAKNQQEDIFWGRDCGADDYITKPFNAPDLEQAVQRLLEHRGGEAAPRGSIDELVSTRIREGGVCGVCSFVLDTRPLTVHLQKYGELKQRQMLEVVTLSISAVLEDEGFQPAVERDGDTFRVMLPCTTDRILAIQDRICERADQEMLEFYDPADRERGHIATRDFHTGEEIHVPLATLRAETPRIYNQD
jgi:twitching motility two-component system response regulator PilH